MQFYRTDFCPNIYRFTGFTRIEHCNENVLLCYSAMCLFVYIMWHYRKWRKNNLEIYEFISYERKEARNEYILAVFRLHCTAVFIELDRFSGLHFTATCLCRKVYFLRLLNLKINPWLRIGVGFLTTLVFYLVLFRKRQKKHFSYEGSPNYARIV